MIKKSLTTFALALTVCAGGYDPKTGTNFGSCQYVDRSSEIQAPGDAGDAASEGSSSSGSSGSAASK